MGITLDVAQEHLDTWLTAEKEIALNQSYTIGTRTLTRAMLSQVREEIKFWQDEIDRIKAEDAADKRGKRNRVYRAIPRAL